MSLPLRALPSLPQVFRASDLAREIVPGEAPWCCQALVGRLVEISAEPGGSSLTLALGLVHDAQRAGEPVAWVSAGPSLFFPPDAAEGGIDLAALPIVRAVGARSAGRAATHLLRSGAFGLVVLDLDEDAALPAPLLARLSKLAQHHAAALVCLTRTPAERPSLGSLVSLRVRARRRRLGDDRYVSEALAIKDKRRAPGWTHTEMHCGPTGLR